MATFHIHEDVANQENIPPNKYTKQAKINDKVKIKRVGENRIALQPLKDFGENHKNGLKCDPPQNTKAHQQKTIPCKKQKVESQTTNEDLSKVLATVEPKKKWIINRTLSIQSIEAEYAQDIWTYLKEFERRAFKVNPQYMLKQNHITWDMRSVLIDWFVSVADEYKMSDQTIHLGVNYLDHFLSNISVVREKFQLVGAATMLIAGKVEDIYPPEVREWAYLSGDAFTVRQILKMEQLVLKVLQFNVNPPTMLDFIKHICAKHELDSKTMHLAMYLSELTLLEGKGYLGHFPSELAASSIALARHTLFKSEAWSKKLELSAGYTLKQLSPVVIKQQKTFKSSPFKEHQAIQTKYKSDKYERVAMMRPRILALDELQDEE